MVTCERPTPARTNVTRLSRNAPACRFKLRMNRKSGTRLRIFIHSFIKAKISIPNKPGAPYISTRGRVAD